MGSELRAAIAGTGFMGTAHARSVVQAGGRLVGVAASSPERSKAAAVRLRADRWFASGEALVVDPDVDVVHLCVPNDLHAPLAHAALAAGKHLICEKPIALDATTADELVRAADGTGLVAAVPFVYRYHPMVRELRARVAAGDLGRVHLVHGTYLQDWLSRPADTDWRLDPDRGGASRAMADIGSHWLDLAEFVLGERIARLSARFAKAFAERANEDDAVVQFETAAGTLGSVVVSQTAPGRKNALTLEVGGITRSARFDQERPGSLWLGGRAQSVTVSADPAELHADAARLVVAPPGHPQGYLDCIDLFVSDVYAAISGETPSGLPTLADGRRAVRLVDAAHRSASSAGTWIEVTP